MDLMIRYTQEWLNDTYGNDSRYNRIDEDGQTGWSTIYALTRALQIELGIQQTADTFGPTTRSLYGQNPLSRNDGVTNNKYGILQGALWCKGYDPGHYYAENNSFSRVFDVSVETAVKELKSDAGILNPNGVVTVNFMAALLSMDAFKLLPSSYGSNANVRSFQQEMNRNYEAYIGIMPCDGVYGRNTNTALIYALQAEEGLPVSVANGNFGPTTKSCCPTIPYNNVEKNYNGATYSSSQISQFTKIFKFGMYVNGFGSGTFTGNLDSNVVKQFQSHHALTESGTANLQTWMSIMISCGDTTRSAKACDTSFQLTDAQCETLVNYGFEVVGRYLSGWAGSSTSGHPKNLTQQEIIRILANGLRYFPIFQEGNDGPEYFDYQQGVTSAETAYAKAKELGIPTGSIIYFAVDFDAMDSQVTSRVIPYFKGIQNYFYVTKTGEYRIGIYSTRNTCTRVRNQGLSVSSFVSDMSTGYSGNLGFKLPDDWAFDQFSETYAGSGAGRIDIDKCGYSGRYRGISVHGGTVNNTDPTFASNGTQSTWRIYRGSSATIYSSYNQATQEIIGALKENDIYAQQSDRWISSDNYYFTSNYPYIHVVFLASDGTLKKGYVKGDYYTPSWQAVQNNDINAPMSVLYGEKFWGFQYLPETDSYTSGDGRDRDEDGRYIFYVNKPIRYFSTNSEQIGMFQYGDKFACSPASCQAGATYPTRMWAQKKWNAQSEEWEDLNTSFGANPEGWVDMGLIYGNNGMSRAIF